MAGMMSSCTARFLIPQLLLISVSTSHVFLPKNKSSQLQRSVSLDGNIFDRQPCLKLRGGSDTDYFDDASVARDLSASENLPPAALVATTALSESATSDTSHSHPSNEDGDGERIRVMDDDEMLYATIGILNIPKAHGDNIVLLSYNSNDDQTRQINEKWGIRRTQETSTTVGLFPADLALAEINGCLCHGTVLNLPSVGDLFSSDSAASQHLDDVFLCVAKGIIRRLKGTQHVTIPLSITFDGDCLIDESAKENATRYIQAYFDRALYHMWKIHVGKTQGIDHATDEGSIPQQCTIVASFSSSSASDTASEMANNLLRRGSADETSKHNVVPRSLFGTLSQQVYGEIRENSDLWEKLSEESQHANISDENDVIDATMKEVIATDTLPESQILISADLKRNVENLMAISFVDAEDSLLGMENKMDGVFLDNDGDGSVHLESHPMPEFSRDVNAIVNTMSSSFLALLDDHGSLTESERDWVQRQRIQALEQVTGAGIHRLFHEHLQSLRDHFGYWYERTLESPTTDDFDRVAYSSQKQRQEAAQQAEEGFRKAAFAAVPEICQHPEGELCNELVGMFSCIETLRGLLEDMYEVTLTRGLEEEEWEGIMGVNTEVNDTDLDPHASSNSKVGLRQLIKNMKAKVKRRGPAKWYERLAAKVFIVGVNYIQGWLVLQALRREATKRDLAMPKFPLF